MQEMAYLQPAGILDPKTITLGIVSNSQDNFRFDDNNESQSKEDTNQSN